MTPEQNLQMQRDKAWSAVRQLVDGIKVANGAMQMLSALPPGDPMRHVLEIRVHRILAAGAALPAVPGAE